MRIQTLTGETQEVEAEPQNSILDLKVMMVTTTVKNLDLVYLNKDKTEFVKCNRGSRISQGRGHQPQVWY